MANKLLKPKRGRVENLPKLAVEDGSLIFAYDTKSPTSTVLVDVGETRYELSAATAKKADDSNALGGSSLQNIVDKIDNATGDGTAFTSLDTTTNNKVKLTRANGTTVEKTINNVSNASTADYAKVSNKIGTGTVGSSTKPVYINAGTPTAVSSIPSTFVTAQQINGVNLDTLRIPGMYWAGGGNTNTNKPMGIDAFGLEVLQSAAGWYTQICYASDDQEKQFVRYYDAGTKVWKDWVEQNRLNTKTQSGYVPAPNAANKVYRTDANGNPGWGTLNDSSINKLASTVTLGDGGPAVIDQNNETYRQRINIFDNAIANDAVFSFQQSTDAGKTYKDLFVVNDNGTVIASTFKGKLKGNADTASNASALGGSSLQNIIDKINNSTGDGTAFTGLDTAINNKIKLTRANGSTVEKTINNVSNASTADYAKDSDKLDGYHETAFLRYRGATNTSADSLWNQIGIKEFYNCYPESLDGVYNYGEVVSLPGAYTRFDIWVNHQSSSGETNGLQYRSGWNDDKKPWRMLLDSGNFSQYAAKKNAYNSASVSNATITLGRSDGSTGTTLTVNNVAHASTANYANSAANASTAEYAKSAPPTANSVNYVRVYNSSNVGGSNTVTVNDLSKKHFAQGMINSATDNPLGKAGWVHVQSMAWADGSDQWASQIAFNVQNGTGAYYRSSNGSGHLAGRDWNKFLDSSNYTEYAADRTALVSALASSSKVTFTRANAGTFAININYVENASTANNANKLGGLPSSEYALKSQLSGDINALSAKRLQAYQSISVANSFFYRYGAPGVTGADNVRWEGFPSAVLSALDSTKNGFGNALYRKNAGVLHLAAGSSAHDLVFQAGGTNVGIAYVATGRNPAYILDTLNYKDRAYTFNKLTASSTFTATGGVVIDGGSY